MYRRLAKKHEVHYFTMRYEGMQSSNFMFEGMHVHCVCDAPPLLYDKGRRKKWPALKFALAVLKRISQLKFDVVDSNQTPFFHTLALWLYKKMKPRTKLISTWHEHWTLIHWQDYIGFFSGLFGYVIQQLTVRVPDFLVCVSEPTSDLVRRIGKRPLLTTRIIWNGIDIDKLREAKEHAKPIPHRIVFVGRLIPEKRVDTFIKLLRRASRDCSKASAVIIGNGPERERLEKEANGLNVEFIGFVESHLGVLKEVAASSVFVSFSEREGFNISALESCQIGLPTFVRKLYFDHENLHKIEESTILAMLDTIIGSPRRNPKIDRRYSWDRIASQLEGICVDLITLMRA